MPTPFTPPSSMLPQRKVDLPGVSPHTPTLSVGGARGVQAGWGPSVTNFCPSTVWYCFPRFHLWVIVARAVLPSAGIGAVYTYNSVPLASPWTRLVCVSPPRMSKAWTWQKEGKSQREIAKLLSRGNGSISRLFSASLTKPQGRPRI